VPSKKDLKGRLENLEAAAGPAGEGRERVERAIRRRIGMQIAEEAARMRAPGFRRAKDPKDRVLPPEAERLWGPNYTRAQCYEEAVRRVFDNLEELLARDMFNDGVLLPYVDPEYLTPEGKERLRQQWIEASLNRDASTEDLERLIQGRRANRNQKGR
jgi:hypothetical protein